MEKSVKFSARNRIRSFSFAINGIINLIRNENNAKIHVAIMVGVIVLGILVKIGSVDWMFIGIAIGLVFIAELFNTAVERLADVVSPERSEKIRIIKDYAAGAVLIAALTAAVIGGWVFIPEVIRLLK
jgi:diacylglycerol kinase